MSHFRIYIYNTMASSSNRSSEARRKEGNRLEEDLIRLSGAEKVAKGKVAFWDQQTDRLG